MILLDRFSCNRITYNVFGFRRETKIASMAMESDSASSYPSASRISDSSCFPQYSASLKCLEANSNKRKCKDQILVYKECKKKEREARLERNRNKSFFN